MVWHQASILLNKSFAEMLGELFAGLTDYTTM
jgi:hypothetical protein